MDARSPRLPSRRSILVTVVAATIASALSSLAHPASLLVDGQRMISDVPPVTTPHDAYVPLRVIAETLGADTNYDAKTGSIELVHDNDTLRLRIGERTATLNGSKLTLKKAPFTVRGRAMVSLNVIERAFKTKVVYDGGHAKIDVLSAGLIEAGAQDDTSE
ncbi:MAG: copper amine oxidase N-terminal domain-containing protein [Candidatus Baltobacteraceae bacterium]|jgi:hypothetical protein